MRLVSRPATPDDVRHYYPDITSSFRAWVCEMDGERRGIIGLALTRPVACMFSTFDEELRPYLKSLTILRLIKQTEAAMKAGKVPVRAIAEALEPTAPAILRRIGMAYIGTHENDDIFEWKGDQWRRQSH